MTNAYTNCKDEIYERACETSYELLRSGEQVLDKFTSVAARRYSYPAGKTFVNCSGYSMVNSLDPVYDTWWPVTPAIIAPNGIETYGSFKPLMAMEFPIECAFCQGCLTRPFANFVFGTAIFTAGSLLHRGAERTR